MSRADLYVLVPADVARFEAKIIVRQDELRPGIGPCHEWAIGKNAAGYGWFAIGSRKDGSRTRVLAHRFAWLAAHGDWPRPFACHVCDNPACVRVSHLFVGTADDNMRDMVTKGRQSKGVEHGRPVRGERNGCARLTAAQVIAVRAEYAAERTTQRVLARRYGVSLSAINLILQGKRWSHAA